MLVYKYAYVLTSIILSAKGKRDVKVCVLLLRKVHLGMLTKTSLEVQSKAHTGPYQIDLFTYSQTSP